MKKAAFTLVELSVVLVIIGLIIGGIFVGKDLIAAYQVRSQVSQLQQFDIAVGTFKQKYGYLPGDLPNVAQFDFSGVIPSGYYLGGDGDGRIEDINSNTPIAYTNSEPLFFFIHLKESGLLTNALPKTYFQNTPGVSGQACTRGTSYYGQYIGCQFPEAKIGIGGFTATSLANGNLAYFLGITNKDPTLSNPYNISQTSTGPVLLPADAAALDSKLDDGLPKTGRITITNLPRTADNTSNDCLTTVAQNTYNITNTDLACRLLIESTVH